MTTEVMPISQV